MEAARKLVQKGKVERLHCLIYNSKNTYFITYSLS